MSFESRAGHVERAFRLAYFIHPDRPSAIRVTVVALAYLDDLIKEQDRRRYSRPRTHRTKASRSRPQLLQHLVCCVSESPEIQRLREDQKPPRTADDLLIRFVIHLVRITTRRNSFYVNLGISRILHDYSTAEAMAIHDLLTQDPERLRHETYFRYGKRLLLNEMRQCFGALVEITRGARGELRFCSGRATLGQAALVQECLQLATPWETQCPFPESFDCWHEELSSLRFTGDHPDDEHPIEMRRMHTVLHPRCYLTATRALGFDAPGQRLRIPRFFAGDGRGRRAGHVTRDAALAGRRPQALSEEEKSTIDVELQAIARRRRRWSIRQLSI